MGISTQTAARLVEIQHFFFSPLVIICHIFCRKLKGQRAGLVGGEQTKLSFEEFPHLALSRTYCYDHTVADSACSATAYLCGVKANKDTIGVTAAVKYEDCKAQLEKKNHVDSLLAWAQQAGKMTGIVTTDRSVAKYPIFMNQ